ncbi:MAG: glycosyltransferase [Acidimicrobiia bacterium]
MTSNPSPPPDPAHPLAPAAPDGLDLSVVVAAHDAAATLPEQLDALTAQSWNGTWEIVVVDNASTDDTAVVVRAAIERSPRVRLVPALDGSGPAYARNVGARSARGRALAFCDADDVVAPGWVAAVGDALAAHEFVCGPVEFAQLNPAWLAAVRGSTGTAGAARFEDRFPFASSCNLGVRRDRFLGLGGFDESLHVGEDIDLSMRLERLGVVLEYVPAALVHYRLRPTLRATFDQAVAYGASRPVIAERWRGRSGEQLPRWRGARNWGWLLRHVGDLRHPDGRAHWVWVAGQRVGALDGSRRVRRLYL